MANEQNLIPNSARTPEERRENARKAGKASGVARRRKKSLKEAADLYLSLPVSDLRRYNRLAKKNIDPEDIDNQMAMIVGLAEAATQGDAKAANAIANLLGEGAPKEDATVEQIAKAAELLGGIQSAIE